MLAVVICLGYPKDAAAAEAYKETYDVPTPTEIVTVQSGDDRAAIQEYLDRAKDNGENEYTKVVFPSGGTWKINMELWVYSNTIIEATGARIERTYENSATNTTVMLVNKAKDADSTNTISGYGVSKNIYLIGGTWSGGDLSKAAGGATNVCFVHAQNVNIIDASFDTAYGGHLMEVNAVKDVLIQGCSFDNYKPLSGTDSMALQIDIAHDCKGQYASVYEHNQCKDHASIPTGYLADETVCENVRVLSNSFGTKTASYGKFTAGVGSDKTLTVKIGDKFGIYHNNIRIAGNQVKGSILCRGYTNSVVEGNQITAAADKGIAMKKCKNSKVVNNTITGSAEQAIFVYGDGSYDNVKSSITEISGNTVSNMKENGIAVADKSTVGTIRNNQISSVSGEDKKAIAVYEQSKVTGDISGNIISDVSGDGIYVAGSSSVGNVKENTITGCKKRGILLYEKSAVNNLISNKIDNRSSGQYGIYVNGATISGALSNNEVLNNVEGGIDLYNGAAAANVKENVVNTVTGSGRKGLVVTEKSKVTQNISGNTITNISGDGVYVGSSAAVGDIRDNNILTVSGKGILIYSSSSAKNITSNKLESCKNQAIVVSGAKVSGAISDNTIQKCSEGGISVTDQAVAGSVKNNAIDTISGAAKRGILIYAKAKVTEGVSGNRISNVTGDGIFVGDGAFGGNITGNTITKAGAKGIGLMSASAGSITGNTISDAGDGSIILNKSTASSLSGNKITNGRSWGIYIFTGSTVSSVTGNTVTDCKNYGIGVNASTVSGSISGNTITRNDATGIQLITGKVDSIYSNTVTGCKNYGVGIGGSSTVGKLYGNNLSGNGTNVNITTASKVTSINQTGYEIAVKTIKTNLSKATIGIKEKIALKAKVSPTNATNKKVTFTSSNKKILTVTSKGVVTGRKKGRAKVIVQAGGKKKAVTITVKPAPKKAAFSAKSCTLKKGKTKVLKVKLTKGSASYKRTFKSSNSKIVKVSSTGKIKGMRKGKAIVTVTTYNKKKAKIKVVVK